MKKLSKIFVPMVLASLVFGGVLGAQDRDPGATVRGTFVRLVEQEVGGQVYLGIAVRSFDSGGQVTVLVPQDNEDLRQAARRLQEGQNIDIAFATEGRNNWATRIEAGRPRDRAEDRPQPERRTAARTQRPRDTGRSAEGPEARRAQSLRGDQPRERFRAPEQREPARPLPPVGRMEGQLREVITRHMERMGIEMREVLAAHLERMEAESRELRAHVERMEVELTELRAQNERLRRQLPDRGDPGRERQPQRVQPRERDPQVERREPEERPVQRDPDQRREPSPSPQ